MSSISPDYGSRITVSGACTKATRARGAALAAHSSGRRRNVDRATCEREYSSAELEFMLAIRDYQARSGRKFPAWSEVLEVVRDLGYAQSQAPWEVSLCAV
jgi:hypothetical protein